MSNLLRVPHAAASLALIGLAALATGISALPAPAAATAASESASTREDWSTVAAEYRAAAEAWQAAYDSAADVRTRRALRDEHPAAAFWSRVEAVADGGEGRALLWMLDNAGPAGITGAKGRGVRAGVHARLFPTHVDAAWFEAVLVHLARDRRAVGDETFERYLTVAAAESDSDVVRARALLVHGAYLVDADEPERVDRGWALLERAAAIEDAAAAQEAAELLYVQRHLVVGAVAPNFVAETIDGERFDLAPLRGKIVVLDFFGFW